jgi:uncharacterized protein
LWEPATGGRQHAAAYLARSGADVNGIPEWEKLSWLDAETRSGAIDLADLERGAKTAAPAW